MKRERIAGAGLSATAPVVEATQGRPEVESLSALLERIEATHHARTRELLEAIEREARVLDGPVVHAPMARVLELARALASELGPHLLREERVLFPYVRALERATRDGVRLPRPPFGTVANPVKMMSLEHEHAGALLAELRERTTHYRVADERDVTVTRLYRALEALDADLVEHMRVENDEAFPRAIELEARSAR